MHAARVRGEILRIRGGVIWGGSVGGHYLGVSGGILGVIVGLTNSSI